MELVLAVALASIVFAVIYTALFETLQTKRYTESLRDVDRTVEGIFRRWLVEIKGTVSYNGQATIQGISSKEEIRRDNINFITGVSPVYTLKEDTPNYVHEVGYYPKEDEEEEGVFWLYRREEAGTDFNLQGGGVSRKLFKGLSLLEIDYYNGEEWVPDWQQNSLPIAIRFKIGLQQIMPNLIRGGDSLTPTEFLYQTTISLPRSARIQ